MVLSNSTRDDPVALWAESPSRNDSTLPGASIDNHSAETLNSNDNISSFPWTNPSISVSDESNAMPSFNQVVKRAQQKVIESNVEKQLVSSLPPDIQDRVRASANVHDALVQVVREGLVSQPNNQLVACLQELKERTEENNELAYRIMDMTSEHKELTTLVTNLQDTLNAKQDEMNQLQIQALHRLARLQNSVRVLLRRHMSWMST